MLAYFKKIDAGACGQALHKTNQLTICCIENPVQIAVVKFDTIRIQVTEPVQRLLALQVIYSKFVPL